MVDNKKLFEYALPIGTVLKGGHDYKIGKVLNQGGFGITYKVAAQVMMGNIPFEADFAIKEFFYKGHCYRGGDGLKMEYSKASAQDVEESFEDFKKEANRLKDICKGNKNIVNVNEVFFANNTAYYVMEYIDGGDIRKMLLDRKSGLSENEAFDIIIPIANAVSYIHSKGIMHLDIKPDNIVIREKTKEPVLIDFGVSLHFNKKGEITTTHVSTGASIGYAPQEQFAGITRFAPEVDVYALAATLFYMLVGRDPKSAFDIKPGDVEEALSGKVSDRVKNAIVHAMKSVSYERTQTASDFVDEIFRDSPSPDTYRPLPPNYVLHLGNTSYLIIGVVEKSDIYMKYEVARYIGQHVGPGSNLTVKKTFAVYEYFAKGVHERKKGNTVSEHIKDSASREKFAELAFRLIRERPTQTYKVGSHIFETNGTLYFIEAPKPDPIPPTPVWKYAKIGGVVIALLLAIGLISQTYHSCNEDKQEVVVEPDKPEQEQNANTTDLPDNSNDNGAEESELEDIISLHSSPVTNESASSSESILGKKEAEPANTEETSRDMEAELFQKAKDTEDWAQMMKLARKGYKPACGALARHYIASSGSKENHCRAYYWARRASKSDMNYVMDLLEKYGFLFEGEPMVTCDNIIY